MDARVAPAAFIAPSYAKQPPARHSPALGEDAWTQIAVCTESPPSPTVGYWMNAVEGGDDDGRHVVPWKHEPSHSDGGVSDAHTQTPARIVGFEVPPSPGHHEYDAQHGKHDKDCHPYGWGLQNPPCIVQQ